MLGVGTAMSGPLFNFICWSCDLKEISIYRDIRTSESETSFKQALKPHLSKPHLLHVLLNFKMFHPVCPDITIFVYWA